MHIYCDCIYCMNKKISIVLFFLLYSFIETLAQHVSSKHYTINNQLPSNICYRILQDENGLIIVATEKGLSVFDGYEFHVLPSTKNLKIQDVWGVFKDSYNRLWLKSKDKGNKYLYKDSIFEINSSYIPLLGYNSVPIFYKEDSTDSNFYILDEKNNIISQKCSSIIINAIKKKGGVAHKYYDDKKIITKLYSNGIYELLDLNTMQVKQRLFKKGISLVFNSKSSSDNKEEIIYFYSGDSVFSISNAILKFETTLSSKHLPADIEIKGVIGNAIFYSVDNKLKVLDRQFNNLHFDLPQIESPVSQVYEDREHNLWFNTIGDGIYFVSSNAIHNKIYNMNNGLLDNNIVSLYKTDVGKLYIGYYREKYVQSIERGKINTIPKNFSAASTILGLNNDDIVVNNDFISKRKYNFSIQTAAKNFITRQNNYYIKNLNISTKSLLKIDETNFLIGTNSYLWKASINYNTLRIDTLVNLNNDIYTMCLYENRILLGTASGLYVYKNNTVYDIGNAVLSLKENIRSVKIDNSKRIWVASDYTKLACYDSNYHFLFSVPELQNSIISSLEFDDFAKDIYASTTKGLYRITSSAGAKNNYQLLHYSISEGLPTEEVNCCVVDKDNIYVATSLGLAVLKKNSIKSTHSPTIYIAKIEINNNTIPIQNAYNISYKENNIRIALNAISLQSFGNINYYYRLNTEDDKWIKTNQRIIEFSSLKPGNYTFEAKAVDINNNETLKNVFIRITINPPFWKTWLFLFVASIFLLSIISYIIYYFIQKSKMKELEEARIIKERAELQLTALQSQLNSHFVYNSLNAIQKFILSNDEIAASDYMNKFAKLIRLFLESSRKKYSPIATEIEIIKLYTTLEMLRFSNIFEIQLDYSKLKDLSANFPTNFIQPFVENAILHGLIPNKKNGLLKIIFTDNDNEIICSIEDNGIGREKSKELSKQQEKKSLGMELIQDKIKNYGSVFENQINIEIIDKQIITHNSTGTIVIITYKK